MNKYTLIVIMILPFCALPAIAGNRIINKSIGAIDTVFQIQDSTIKKIGEIDLNTSTSLTPLISENQIFSPSDDGLIYCYDLNGNKRWVTEITGNIATNLVRFKDLILTATSQGDLYSINANNGDVVQVMGVGENITTDLLLINFTDGKVLSKAVVFGTVKGNIFCYDIFSFEMIWKNKLSHFPIIANMVEHDDKIITFDETSIMYCINSKSGILIWKFDFTSKDKFLSKPKILSDGKSVFYLSPVNEIFSIDLLLGRKIWSTKSLEIFPQIYLSYDNQYLILLSTKGELIFISSKDGKELGRSRLKTKDLTKFICVNSSDYTMALMSDGTIFRIDDNYSLKELMKFSNINITSFSLLSDKQFIISTDEGKIFLFKFDKK